MVRAVNDAVERCLRDDRVGKERVPVLGCPVGGDHRREAAVPLSDQFEDVVGLLRGELAEAEVIDDEDIRVQVSAEAAVPGTVGMAASEVGEEAVGARVEDLVAQATGTVADGLQDMGFARADWTADDDRLSSFNEVAGGPVPDLLCGHLGIEGEVELL